MCTGFYNYFKFDVLAVRGGHGGDPDKSADNCMQFADLLLFDIDGSTIPVDHAASTNPGGNNPDGEGPGGGTDGDLDVKFLDLSFGTNVDGGSTLIFGVQGDKRMIRGYEFFTANDHNSRDPVRWRLSGGRSPDGPWYEFSYVTDAAPPLDRKSSYGVFDPCVSN
jgi:hypothetical protein